MRIIDTVIGGLIGAGFGWLFCSKQFATWGVQEYSELLASVSGLLIGAIIAFLLSPYARTRSNRRMVSPYGMIVSVLAVLLWLIPMGMTGSFKSKLYTVPAVVRNQYRISCLFTHSSKYWHTVHYQVRLNGQMEWIEGPLEGFFDLDIFGYRSKLNRIVLASRYKAKKGPRKGKVFGRNQKRLEEMGAFIGQRWKEIYPEDPEVKAVRFYRVGHKVGEEHCMSRDPWSRPSLDSIPENKRELIHSFSLTPSVALSGRILADEPPDAEILFIIARRSKNGPIVALKKIASPQFPVPFELGKQDVQMGNKWPQDIWLEVRLDIDGDFSTKSPQDWSVQLDDPIRSGREKLDVQLEASQ